MKKQGEIFQLLTRGQFCENMRTKWTGFIPQRTGFTRRQTCFIRRANEVSPPADETSPPTDEASPIGPCIFFFLFFSFLLNVFLSATGVLPS